ncbi:hypothetical protein [Sinomonas sp.]|uniref:hypothetical protein n=1 Tax=Sinomonas sp. TaxID=1914986 RepID=UPI002FE2B561
MPEVAANDDGGRPRGLSMGQIIDHALLDRDGRRAGRVDDLEFELVEGRAEGDPPRLVLRAIVSGPAARPMPRALSAAARACYRMIGVRDPGPATVAWSHVKAIDAFVHLDVERVEAGLRAVDEAALRFVRRLPGSGREEA